MSRSVPDRSEKKKTIQGQLTYQISLIYDANSCPRHLEDDVNIAGYSA